MRKDSANWVAVRWRERREWRVERIWECDGGFGDWDWSVMVEWVTGCEDKEERGLREV